LRRRFARARRILNPRPALLLPLLLQLEPGLVAVVVVEPVAGPEEVKVEAKVARAVKPQQPSQPRPVEQLQHLRRPLQLVPLREVAVVREVEAAVTPTLAPNRALPFVVKVAIRRNSPASPK
jgi:hypothetical protein